MRHINQKDHSTLEDYLSLAYSAHEYDNNAGSDWQFDSDLHVKGGRDACFHNPF